VKIFQAQFGTQVVVVVVSLAQTQTHRLEAMVVVLGEV
jgi:hypothetical protein